jgi:endoglucanase
MKPLIQKLVETAGPSGYEAQVRDVIRAEVEEYADEIQVDALGNLIVRKWGRKVEGKRIMLSAHMDEIGLIATHVDEKGFVRFTSVGGVFLQYCLGGRVRFLNGASGVIGVEGERDLSKVDKLDKMFIDLGLRDNKKSPVRVGDMAVFDRPFTDLGDRLVSKAMDDRIGVAVMIAALQKLKQTPHEVFFVFSVQEEVGLRGATTAAYGIDPDLAIALDVTRSGDTPKGFKMAVSLGDGPAIKVRDGGMLSDPRVVDWMVRAAESEGLLYQLEVLEGGTTDARAMQLTRAGVPAGCISIPCRYVHSPSEMVDVQDVQNAVSLLLAMISHPVDWTSIELA